MESVKDRLNYIFDLTNLSNYEINRISLISEATLSRIRGDKPYSPQNATIMSAAVAFNIDFGWIKHGTGTKPTSISINPRIESNATDLGWLDGDYESHITKNGNEHVILSDNNYLLTVKLVSQKAYAGYLAGFSQPEYLKELPSLQTSVKNFHNGTYRAFEVKGDSMDCDKKYAIQEGDIAIGRQLHQDMWKYKLHIHDYKEWLIVHDGGIIIKHISSHDVENGIIHCVSYNEDKVIYPDFELNLKDVYELYNVIKIEKFR